MLLCVRCWSHSRMPLWKWKRTQSCLTTCLRMRVPQRNRTRQCPALAHIPRVEPAGWAQLQTFYPGHFTGDFSFSLGLKDCANHQGPAFHCCGELSSAICSRLSWKVFRLLDCICCILHFIGHFPHRMVNRTEAVGGICSWRYFGIVFLCLIASLFFEKHGSTVKTKCMCSFTFCFTWSMWLGKTRFLLKPQGLSEEKFCIAQVVHELPSIFSSFSSWTIHDMCFGTLLWKLKTYLVSPLLCLFYFANHVYRKDIINGILQMELYSFEHSSTLKRNSTKNCTILLAIILIRLL